MNERNAIVIQSEILKAIGVPHGFFTRRGGVEKPPFDSLDLSSQRAETPAGKTNLDRVLERMGASTMALPIQVHGTTIWVANQIDGRKRNTGPEADGAISTDPTLAVGVLTADCVPILISDEKGRAVAAVHGGWRGLYDEIIPKAVSRLKKITGKSEENFYAAIGPAIGQCCFETGEDVYGKFYNRFHWADQYIEKKSPKAFISLAEIARHQLILAGLIPDRIDRIELCTRCENDRFFSFRRNQKEAGRQISTIKPKTNNESP